MASKPWERSHVSNQQQRTATTHSQENDKVAKRCLRAVVGIPNGGAMIETADPFENKLGGAHHQSWHWEGKGRQTSASQSHSVLQITSCGLARASKTLCLKTNKNFKIKLLQKPQCRF